MPQMQRQQPPARPAGGDGFELGLVIVLGAVMLVVGIVYAGAWLAATLVGGHVRGGLTELLPVIGRLAKHPGDPAAAWGPLAAGLPGAGIYWACTIGLVALAITIVTLALITWRRRSQGSASRLGVEPDARLAKRSDVAPIVISSPVPPVGRMLLGQLAPSGPMLENAGLIWPRGAGLVWPHLGLVG